MKKITILSLLIIAMSGELHAAQKPTEKELEISKQENDGEHSKKRHKKKGDHMKGDRGLDNLRDNPQFAEEIKKLDEYRSELKTELSKENPDFDRVEELNEQIAVEKATLKTEMMKEGHQDKSKGKEHGNNGSKRSQESHSKFLDANPELKEDKLELDQYQDELRVEMDKETPDFDRVEELNEQIGKIEAELKTEMMKYRHENGMTGSDKENKKDRKGKNKKDDN